MPLPKLLIIGHGRHGKDTVCEILNSEFNYTFQSSSQFCSKLFIFDMLKDKYGYRTEEECYNDRHSHRTEWFDAIVEYNTPDKAALGRAIFSEFDIYCGLRNREELYAMKNTGVYDYAVWVDRSDILPPEPKESMNLEQWMADFTIYNNSDIEDLRLNVRAFASYISKLHSSKLRT